MPRARGVLRPKTLFAAASTHLPRLPQRAGRVQLAGLAEESSPHGRLVFRPPYETMRRVGSAQLRLQTPQGEAQLSWRYAESRGLLGLLRDKYSREFEANVSLPLQLPRATQLHIPIPSHAPSQGHATPGTDEQRRARPAALQERPRSVLLREHGCDCILWASDGRQLEAGSAAGVVSVELAMSPLAKRMEQAPDTVVVSLTSGDFRFHVGVPNS